MKYIPRIRGTKAWGRKVFRLFTCVRKAWFCCLIRNVPPYFPSCLTCRCQGCRDNAAGAHLDEFGGEASRDADPVDGGDEAVPGHRAEDERAQLLPLLTEVMRVDLSEEDRQDHRQDRHQVHLTPVLPGTRRSKVKSCCRYQFSLRALDSVGVSQAKTFQTDEGMNYYY